MTVKIQLKDQSQPTEYYDVLNTYVKAGFFCIYVLEEVDETEEKMVYKYPIQDIWRIKESY
jgi:hypothetical protein